MAGIVYIRRDVDSWKIADMCRLLEGPTYTELVQKCAKSVVSNGVKADELLLFVNGFQHDWFGMKYEPQDLIEFANEVAKTIINWSK